MKRKQMVERIYDLLNCDGVLEYSMPKLEPVPLTEEHVRWIAEQIVQEVERGGMLPPRRKALSWSELGIPHYDQTEKPNFTVYKWEPEDEEK
jgi:hypothetical protein